MVEVVLRIERLSHVYPDGSPGLSDVSLEVGAGEIVLLLGANGTGKSTLLRCIVGLLPGQGVVEVCGVRLGPKNMRAIRLVAGLLFQEPDDQLFCPTVVEDVAYGPLHRGLDPEEARAIAVDSLRRVGLEGFEERAPHHLSHGEKKRVALAGVLALSPTLLLLDEPTSGLDPRSATGLMEVLERHRAEGKAILATTHDLHLVDEVADRVAILGEDRRLVRSGKPEEILADAALLRQHNLLHAHRHRHGPVVHAHAHGPLHEHAAVPGEESRSARLHRLEHLIGNEDPWAHLGLLLVEGAAVLLGRAPERVRLRGVPTPPWCAVADGVQAWKGLSLGGGRLSLEPATELELEAVAGAATVVVRPRAELLALMTGGSAAPDLLALPPEQVWEQR